MKKMFFVIAMTFSCAVIAQKKDGIGILEHDEYGKHADDNQLQNALHLDPTDKANKKEVKKLNKQLAIAGLENLQEYYKTHLAKVFPGVPFETIVDSSVEVAMPDSLVKIASVGYVQKGTGLLKFFRRSPYQGERCLMYKGKPWASTYCWNPITPDVSVSMQSLVQQPQGVQQPNVVYAPQQQVQQPTAGYTPAVPVTPMYPAQQPTQVVILQQPPAVPVYYQQPVIWQQQIPCYSQPYYNSCYGNNVGFSWGVSFGIGGGNQWNNCGYPTRNWGGGRSCNNYQQPQSNNFGGPRSGATGYSGATISNQTNTGGPRSGRTGFN